MSTDTKAIDISEMSMRERVQHFRMMTFQWFPYLSPYVYSLGLIERPGIGTMAVDRHGRMYFDPAFVKTLTLEQGGYVVIHEAWHLILRHCHRAEDIIGKDPTARQRHRLNVAYDCVVWELMESIQQFAPTHPDGEIVTFPTLQKRYPKLVRNMLPGEIYSVMVEQDEEEEREAEKRRQQEQERREQERDQQQDEQSGDDEEEFDPDIEADDERDDWDDTDWSGVSDPEDEASGGDEQGDDDGKEIGLPVSAHDHGEDGTDESGEDTDGGSESEGTDADSSDDGEAGDDDGEGGESSDGDGPAPKFEDLKQIGGGSCADGLPREYEEEASDPWDQYIEDKLLEEVEAAIEKEEDRPWTPGRGTVPSALKRVIKEQLHPAPNPWDQLRATVSAAAANPRGRADFTYRRINRRQFAIPGAPRLKGTQKYMPKACVVIDTSGSMTSGCLAKALVVIKQGLQALGKVPVITCDADVHQDVVLSSFNEDFELIGGGGTDMRIPIAHAEEHHRPEVIVLVTDTETPWPDKPTRARLIVAATQDGTVPAWATMVRIPDSPDKTRLD